MHVTIPTLYPFGIIIPASFFRMVMMASILFQMLMRVTRVVMVVVVTMGAAAMMGAGRIRRRTLKAATPPQSPRPLVAMAAEWIRYHREVAVAIFRSRRNRL
jgi:hypothetical protein